MTKSIDSIIYGSTKSEGGVNHLSVLNIQVIVYIYTIWYATMNVTVLQYYHLHRGSHAKKILLWGCDLQGNH